LSPILTRSAAVVALLALAGCIPATAPAPTPAPAPAPAPVPQDPVEPARPAPPVQGNWLDAPQTAGDWRWRRDGAESLAQFSAPDGRLLVQMACTAQRQVALTVVGAAPGQLTIRTETASQSQTATSGGGGARSQFAARDPLLDAIAFSRGRFAIEAAGLAPLYLPSYPELTRVVEDCR
jgi:hypothetical protein